MNPSMDEPNQARNNRAVRSNSVNREIEDNEESMNQSVDLELNDNALRTTMNGGRHGRKQCRGIGQNNESMNRMNQMDESTSRCMHELICGHVLQNRQR